MQFFEWYHSFVSYAMNMEELISNKFREFSK
jgi:hypothetical protein